MSSLAAFAVFAAVGAILLKTMHPSMGDGDSSEFSFRSAALTVAHPPGYPLLVIITHFADTVAKLAAGFSDDHSASFQVQNVSSVLLSSAAASLLFLTCFQQLRCGLLASLTAVCCFSFSSRVWITSHQLDVFPLQNFLATALLYAFCRWRGSQPQGKALLVVMAYIAGLSLAHEHASILILIPVLVNVAWSEPAIFVSSSSVLTMVASFSCGLAPYALLPLRALFDEARSGSSYNLLSWGRLNSLDAIAGHILRRELGAFSMSSFTLTVLNWESWNHGLVMYAQSIVKDLTPIGIVLILLGLFVALVQWARSAIAGSSQTARQSRHELFWVGLCLFSALSTIGGILPTLAAASQNNDMSYFERYWQQPLLPLCVLLAIAVQSLLTCTTCSTVLRTVIKLCVCAFFIHATLLANMRECDHSQNNILETFGSLLIEHVPPNSLLLMNGNLMYFTPLALQTVERLRPDVCIISQTLMTTEWYVEALKSTTRGTACITIPKGRSRLHPDPEHHPQAFTYKDLFDVNVPQQNQNEGKSRRRVFVGGQIMQGDESYSGHYAFAPYGMLQEVISSDAFDVIAQIAEEDRPLKSHTFWTPKRIEKNGLFVLELMRSLPLSILQSHHHRFHFRESTFEHAALESMLARYAIIGEQLLVFSYVDETSSPDDDLSSLREQSPVTRSLIIHVPDAAATNKTAHNVLDELADHAVSGSLDGTGLPVRLRMLLVARRLIAVALHLRRSMTDQKEHADESLDVAGYLNALQLQIGVLQNLARFFMHDYTDQQANQPRRTPGAGRLRENNCGRQVVSELISSLEDGENVIHRSANGPNAETEEIRETLAEVRDLLKLYRNL